MFARRVPRVRVLPGPQPQQFRRERVREGADVAGREDIGIAGGQHRIDQDAAIDASPARSASAVRGSAPMLTSTELASIWPAVGDAQHDAAARRRCPRAAGDEDDDPPLDVACQQKGGDRHRHAAAQEARRHLEDGHVGPQGRRARRDLEADEAAADDGEPRALDQHLPQRARVPEVAQHMHPLGQAVRKRQPARLAAVASSSFA